MTFLMSGNCSAMSVLAPVVYPLPCVAPMPQRRSQLPPPILPIPGVRANDDAFTPRGNHGAGPPIGPRTSVGHPDFGWHSAGVTDVPPVRGHPPSAHGQEPSLCHRFCWFRVRRMSATVAASKCGFSSSQEMQQHQQLESMACLSPAASCHAAAARSTSVTPEQLTR